MRRPVLALALLLGVVGATTQHGSTASSALPDDTTAVHRSTTVNGASMLSTTYTVVAGRITAVQPKLRGTALLAGPLGLLARPVSARYGSDASVSCVITASTLLNSVTRLAEATYNCPLLPPGEQADRPRPLVITVS